MTFTTNGRQKSRTDNKMARGLVTLSLSVVIVELLFFYFWCQTPNINTANNERANENNEKEMAETIMPCQSDRQTDMPGAQLRLHSTPFRPLIEGIKTRWAAGERAQMQATPRRQRRDGTHTASNASSPPPSTTPYAICTYAVCSSPGFMQKSLIEICMWSALLVELSAHCELMSFKS